MRRAPVDRTGAQLKTLPPDFYKQTFSADDVSCNDAEYANHCLYHGKYAFLRTVEDWYPGLPTGGVYGGKYCNAQCEPRANVPIANTGGNDANQLCVCVCTSKPHPESISRGL